MFIVVWQRTLFSPNVACWYVFLDNNCKKTMCIITLEGSIHSCSCKETGFLLGTWNPVAHQPNDLPFRAPMLSVRTSDDACMCQKNGILYIVLIRSRISPLRAVTDQTENGTSGNRSFSSNYAMSNSSFSWKFTLVFMSRKHRNYCIIWVKLLKLKEI